MPVMEGRLIFAAWVKEERKRRRKTIVQCANAAGVVQSAWSTYEDATRKAQPERDTVIKIADALADGYDPEFRIQALRAAGYDPQYTPTPPGMTALQVNEDHGLFEVDQAGETVKGEVIMPPELRKQLNAFFRIFKESGLIDDEEGDS